MVHLALDERSVLLHLALDLPICITEIVIEKRDSVVIAERLPVHIIFVNLGAPRMTWRAHLDFLLRCSRLTTMYIARCEIDPPGDVVAFVQLYQ